MELSENLLKLTPREIEVVKMVAEGMTSKEIAKRFSLSHRTAEWYQEEIRGKLGAKSQGNLVAIAIRSGIIK